MKVGRKNEYIIDPDMRAKSRPRRLAEVVLIGKEKPVQDRSK